jgi:hypothetical protein
LPEKPTSGCWGNNLKQLLYGEFKLQVQHESTSLAAAQQNMGMIGDQRPGKARGFHLAEDLTQPFNEIIPVLIKGWEV